MYHIFKAYMHILVSNASGMLLRQVHDLYLQVRAQDPTDIVQ